MFVYVLFVYVEITYASDLDMTKLLMFTHQRANIPDPETRRMPPSSAAVRLRSIPHNILAALDMVMRFDASHT